MPNSQSAVNGICQKSGQGVLIVLTLLLGSVGVVALVVLVVGKMVVEDCWFGFGFGFGYDGVRVAVVVVWRGWVRWVLLTFVDVVVDGVGLPGTT